MCDMSAVDKEVVRLAASEPVQSVARSAGDALHRAVDQSFIPAGVPSITPAATEPVAVTGTQAMSHAFAGWLAEPAVRELHLWLTAGVIVLPMMLLALWYYSRVAGSKRGKRLAGQSQTAQ